MTRPDTDHIAKAIFYDLIHRFARLVGATEAAGFVLGAPGDVLALTPYAHVRPGPCTAEERAAAIEGFQEMAGRCLRQGADGMFVVDDRRRSNPPQWCLVALLGHDGPAFAVMTFIVRCDEAEARRRLRLLGGHRGE